MDLDGILQFIALFCLFALFLQLLDLLLIAFDGGFHLFQFQPLLVQRQLQLLCIIPEQLLTDRHIVTGTDKQFLHGHLMIFVDLGNILRHHYTCKHVAGGDASHIGKCLHRLDKDCRFVTAAGRQYNAHAYSEAKSHTFFHIPVLHR